MMPLLRHLLIAGLLSSLATSCAAHRSQSMNCAPAPVLTSISIVDRNGMTETLSSPERLSKYLCVDFLQPQSFQKVLRIYSRDCEGNIPAIITSYHPNGYPHKYLEIVNGRANGLYQEWYPNGVKRLEAHVIEGVGDIAQGSETSWVFDGLSQVWRESGELEAAIPYSKGNLEGVSNYYHPNGELWKVIPYCDGKINGLYEVYKSDGTLLAETNYVNGLKEGEAVRYWQCDQLASQEEYCEDLLVTGLYYDGMGQIIATIKDGTGIKAIFGKEEVIELREYHNGRLEGSIKILDVYGRVTRLYNVKNGCKHGEEIIYSEAPRLQKVLNPKLSVTWYEGKVQGIAKTWYDNGAQESQRELSNNKRNGHSTAWYRDGSLMFIEEYEQDKLIRGEYYSKKEKFPITQVKEGRGTATLYDGDGNFIQKINYLNGKPVVEEDPQTMN